MDGLLFAPWLDLELRRQELLAQSEQEEVGALANYSTAIAQRYAAMGTALERNRISFNVQDSAEAFLNVPGFPVQPPPVRTGTEAMDAPPRPAGSRP